MSHDSESAIPRYQSRPPSLFTPARFERAMMETGERQKNGMMGKKSCFSLGERERGEEIERQRPEEEEKGSR